MDTSHTPPVSTLEQTPHARAFTGDREEDTAPRGGGELLAVGDNPYAGRIVWWRLDGGVDAEEFNAAWESVGGDVTAGPKPRGPHGALRYAVAEVATAHRHLARPVTGGFVVVRDEGESKGTVRHRDAGSPLASWKATPLLAAYLVESETQGAPPELRLDPETSPLAEGVREAFERFQRTLTTREVATWLPAEVRRADGVALRDTGGVYFVPAAGLDAWDRVVRAFAMSSEHVFQGVAVTRADDAAAAFLDAVSEEARAFVEAATEETAKLGARGRRHLAARAKAMREKVARYEALFGDERLGAVREALSGFEFTEDLAAVMASAEPGDGV